MYVPVRYIYHTRNEYIGGTEKSITASREFYNLQSPEPKEGTGQIVEFKMR